MMRKILAFIISFAIILSTLIVPVYAKEAPIVSVGAAYGKCGTSVEVPVLLSGNTGFVSLGVEIKYDDSALKLTNVAGNTNVGATFTQAQSYSANPYNLGWSSADNITFNGTLATLTFEILTDKSGNYPITIEYYKGRTGEYTDGYDVNYDADYNSLGLTYTSGRITVEGNSTDGGDAQSVTVSVGETAGKQGDVVEVPVSISNNTGFVSLGVEIDYNNSALELTGVTSNANVGATFTQAQSYAVKPYNLGWSSADNIVFNGTLVTLTFKVLTDKMGEYPVTVDYYKGRDGSYTDGYDVNYDADFNSLNLSYMNGKITVHDTDARKQITISDYNIADKISFTAIVTSQEVISGNIIATVYDNDSVVDIKILEAKSSVDVPLNTNKGEYIKVMWWDTNDLSEFCEPVLIPIQ